MKSSTKNPDLNLFNPWESFTSKVFVSNSSNDKDVNSSKFSTLSSILPISLIVYLLLSTRDIFTSSGLLRYGGNSIVAICIEFSTVSGTLGSIEDEPLVTINSPLVLRTTLSVLGR